MKTIRTAVVLMLMSSGIAYAQLGELGCHSPSTGSNVYTLHGTIIIPARDHAEIFDVFLLSRSGEQILARTIADSGGRYCFLDVPENTYDFVVRLEGFKELREPARIGNPPPPLSMKGVYEMIFWLTPVDDVVVIDERLRGYPKEAIDEYVLAMKYDSDKNYKEVVKHLERVVTLAADWYDAHCELGAAYEEDHRDSDAEKEYRKAVELKPDGLRALMSLGRFLVSKVNDKIQAAESRDVITPILSQAHEALVSAVMSDPKSAMAIYLLGTVDFRLGAYADAEKELKQSLELDSTMFPARLTLINVYVEQKKWQAALDNLDEFLLGNPLSPYRAQAIASRTGVMRQILAAQ